MKRLLLMLLSLLLLCSCTGENVKPALDMNSVLHTDARLIVSPDGEQILIKGMALGNGVWDNPSTAPENHHNEDTYRELSELGFNSVRFYLNYGLFEDDDNPYVYKEEGFDWIDKNIKWAKKYGIGIILNMHYPQGGYQSQGEGDALWNDKENQDRLSALWCEIATRYAGEPTIWGYGLINEPIVTWQGSRQASIDHFKCVMQRLINDMRECTNQALIVEKLMSIDMGDYIDWSLSLDESFCVLEGENIIYEYHNYSPHKYTHQDMDWADTVGGIYSYPDENNVVSVNMIDDWVDCLTAKKKSEDGEWSYFEAERVYKGTENYNMGVLALNARNVNEGKVYYDDIKVTEISPDGEETVVVSYSFGTNTVSTLSPWSSNGTGKLSYSPNGHDADGCVAVTGTTADYTVNCGDRFPLKEGYTYRVSGYLQLENCTQPTVRIDYANAESYMTLNKDYLEAEMLSFINFSEKHNVAIYMGEFGTCTNSFLYARGGATWVADMLELCNKYDVNYNYHTYHEGSFGLYTSGADTLPKDEDINQALYDCFMEHQKK